MSTIDSIDIILELLQNNGCFSDDPQCVSIWKYTTRWNNETYAVFYKETNTMFHSPDVHFPELLMYRGKLTDMGRKFLNDNSN